MKVLRYAALAVAAVAPAVWVLWPAGESALPAARAQAAPPGRDAAACADAGAAPAAGAACAAAAVARPFAPSMSGTRPDGNVRHDGAAHLIVDEELAHLFDYYLSALGEQSLPAIRAGIERELRQRLPATAAGEAIALLDRYIAYKRALATAERALPATLDRAEAASNRLQTMQRLRADYFSPAEAEGLFGAADKRDRAAIAMFEDAQSRTGAAAAAKAGGMSAAGADTSAAGAGADHGTDANTAAIAAAERAERDTPIRVLTLEANVQQARSRGAGDNEIYQMRAAALSPEAAARLADVDREEADWQRRIAAYRAARASPGANTMDAAALQQLRDAQFSPQEQKRLDAYE